MVNINLSNRWLYSILTVVIVILAGVVVWAAATPGVSHDINEIDFMNEIIDLESGNLIFSGSAGDIIRIEGDGSLIGIGRVPLVKLDVEGKIRATELEVAGDVKISGNLGLNVQMLTCDNNQLCDLFPSVNGEIQADCPSGYILTGCSPFCEDSAGLRTCGVDTTIDDPIPMNTCAAGCYDSSGSGCDTFYINLICMRITDIGND